MIGGRAGLLVVLFVPTVAHASPEPWSDPAPDVPSRVRLGEEYGARAAAEYRASAVYARSIATTPSAQDLSYAEHRLRLDTALDWEDRVTLTTSVDVLDGVVWGDQEASTRAATTNPSVDRLCLAPGPGNPREPSGYTIATCSADPFFVRRLYGEVRLPVGVLRIGRQAYDDGYGVLVADGDGRRNRFGIAYRGDNVDRVMFSTKPLELLAGDGDPAEDRGVFLHVAYDRVSTGAPQRLADDANEVAIALRALAPELGGLRDAEARLFYAHRWEKDPALAVHAIGGRVSYRVGDLHIGADAAAVVGTRGEKSVQQYGTRAVAELFHGLFGGYLELDYASDDFSFAPDSNVGLLLFEQVIGLQSARAAAADGAPEVATGGAFHDAMAIFPQVDLRPTDDVLVRAGALFAWAPTPVSYAGGPPARAYGTELDARASWTLLHHFTVDLEAALLLPGEALADEAGRMPHAGLVQGRGSFFF